MPPQTLPLGPDRPALPPPAVAAARPASGPVEEFVLRGESMTLGDLTRGLVRSRELLVMLARKDFFVRYRRASFGVLWAVGMAVVQAGVMAVVFSHIARIHTGVSYPTFVYAGVLPWLYFGGTLATASTAIVDGQGIATKIYFPRAVLPLVTVAASLYGFVPGLAVLAAFALGFGVPLGPHWVLLAPAIALMVLLTAGFGLVLAAVHVYFRDVRYLVQAALTAWVYLTPTFYPLRLVPGALRPLIAMVPTTGMIELFRAATVGADPGWLIPLGWTLLWTAGLLGAAATLYRRFDRVFVDLL